MQEMNKDDDQETRYKETFRVFSKDEEGCIPADEMMQDPMKQELCLCNFVCRFVLQHLPGKIKPAEIEEMIKTVDKNNDGKISYSEFRVKIIYLVKP